jgi:hypothetical protein
MLRRKGEPRLIRITDPVKKWRTVGELREWLAQFDEGDKVWAYEGEVSGVVVEHGGRDYVFHNELGYIVAADGTRLPSGDENITAPETEEEAR